MKISGWINLQGPLQIYFKRSVVLMLVASVLTMRPALLGELLTKYSLVLLAFTLIFSLSFGCMNLGKRFFVRNMAVAFSIALFWGYLGIHAAMLGVAEDTLLNVVKGTLSISFIVLAYGALLSDEIVNRIFFKALVWIFVVEIVAYCVTAALIYGAGIDAERLIVFHVETGYEERGGWVMFPLTITYGTLSLGNFTLYRLGGPFREAGIFQAFITWAYFSLPKYELDRLWIRIILLLGLVLTMSTAALAVFFSCYVLQMLLAKSPSLMHLLKRIAIAAFGSVATIAIFLYLPVFGLLEKMETRDASVADRSGATMKGFQIFLDNPLGTGMYHNATASAGINFIGATSLIGIVGVVLIVSAVVYAVFSVPGRQPRRDYLVRVFPFILTGLVSQPFLDAPLVFVMLFQSWNSQRNVNNHAGPVPFPALQ